MATLLDLPVLVNWIVENIMQGLSQKTVAFYLDKISSLYSGVAPKLVDGKSPMFKEAKLKLKSIESENTFQITSQHTEFIKKLWRENRGAEKEQGLLKSIIHYPTSDDKDLDERVALLWASLALKAGIKADLIRSIVDEVPTELPILKILTPREISLEERERTQEKVADSLRGEEPKWFAMRLRPRVKFENLLDRFALLEKEIEMPELFYPNEEIAKRVGRKVVWKGRPVIRDVVFFKKRKSEIFAMFTHLYDLAWCYRNPGNKGANYASIPTAAMENFRNSLGVISPDFEIAAAGEMELNPGDEVVIVNGEYMDHRAKISRKATVDEDGNKIFRITLLNSNGHWDIGIDARLLKKT